MPNAIGSAQSSPHFNVSHEGLNVSLGLPSLVFKAMDRRCPERAAEGCWEALNVTARLPDQDLLMLEH